MGKDPKLTAKSSLAKPHPAGASIALTQILAHSRLGAIGYTPLRLWTVHYEASHDYYEQLLALHEQLVTSPVNMTIQIRLINDTSFLKEVYRAGSAMISEVVRTVQHFAEEIERMTGQQPTGSTVIDRIRSATTAAELPLNSQSDGYAAFNEMQDLRDGVEHPRMDRVYSAQEGAWDRVPLAWILSDRSIQAYDRYHRWFTTLADSWEAVSSSYAKPAELEVVRGIGSNLQFKKPPKSAE